MNLWKNLFKCCKPVEMNRYIFRESVSTQHQPHLNTIFVHNFLMLYDAVKIVFLDTY